MNRHKNIFVRISHRFIQKLLLIFIFIVPKIEKLFGLSEFRYKNKRFKALTLLSRAITISFIFLYPFSCIKVLRFLHQKDSDVTFYARNLKYVFNWLLLVFILVSGAFNANDQRVFGEIEIIFRRIIDLQILKENFVLLMRCTLKGLVIFSGQFYLNFRKFYYNMNSNLSMWEKPLIAFPFLPYIIMSLASNRIYVANAVVKNFLMKNLNDLKSAAPNTSLKIKLCAMNYRRAHCVFVDFNRRNQVNLLAILCFCLLNVIYEVI